MWETTLARLGFTARALALGDGAEYAWGMELAVVWDEAYAEHETGEHPECAERVLTVVERLRSGVLADSLVWITPQPASLDDLLRVHTYTYLRLVREASAGRAELPDADTSVARGSYEVASLAAGGATELTRLWGRGLCGFALVRPPGHHAGPGSAAGFCLFNNVAVAAAHLLECEGYERVAIVDWDVHHGDGTQAIFLTDPRVLALSLHQWPCYPGTGAATECGVGEGRGRTVNIPLPPGCTDGDYARAFREVVEPIVRQFRPQALLVAAGYDAHREDLYGDMRVTEAGFAEMARRCASLAEELCGGRLGFVLEGGYAHAAVARSVEAVLRALAGGPALPVGPGGGAGAAALERVREAQAEYWDL